MTTIENSRINSYLSFQLGDESFATNVGVVLNILEMLKITKIPRSPEYMKGVVNLRGEVLPVIDLRMKFGMEACSITSNTCILVMEMMLDEEEIKIGALVDAVREVHEITTEEILPPPTIGSKYRSEFITGMYKDGDSFLMILDMQKIFSLNELTVLAETAQVTAS